MCFSHRSRERLLAASFSPFFPKKSILVRPVPVAVMEQVSERMGTDVAIVFGQTESTGGITLTLPDDSFELKSSTVGIPYPHVDVKIINPATGTVLPLGEPGELCCRGFLVMTGYYNMPEKTAEAIDSEGWLHTGDLATMNEKGSDAQRGKTSMGWFYGFKLHLAVNDRGELLACCLTPGNVDDRTPVPYMVKGLQGKLFGDRGYISAPLTQLLFEQGLHLITRLRKNMKNQLMSFSDKLLLRKRAIIESIIDQLKNISQIEHSRHRSPINFVVHLIAGLLAYSHQDKKPGLHLDEQTLIAA